MGTIDFESAIAYAIGRLRAELPAQFTYHNLWHTQEEVMPTATRLAQLSGASEADIQLLKVATAFHDIGFTEVRKNHELAGSRIVAQVLPRFGFHSAQIELIIGMIIATRLPQNPRTALEEIIADADLDVLGRADFLDRNRCLRQEMGNAGLHFTDKDWLEGQLNFLKTHRYFSQAATALRHAKKEENIEYLQHQLQELAD